MFRKLSADSELLSIILTVNCVSNNIANFCARLPGSLQEKLRLIAYLIGYKAKTSDFTSETSVVGTDLPKIQADVQLIALTIQLLFGHGI